MNANTDREIRVNALPAPTYRYLKVNDGAMNIPAGIMPLDCDISAVGVDRRSAPLSELGEFRGQAGGMGEEFCGSLLESGVTAHRLSVGDSGAGEVVVTSELVDSVPRLGAFELRVGRDATLLAVLDLRGGMKSGCAGARGFAGASLRIILEDGAKVRLVHIGRTDRSGDLAIDLGARIGRGARLEVVGLSLGGGDVTVGVRAALAGDEACFINNTGYYCDGKSHLDMNYIAEHQGRGTSSEMIFRGVLSDRSEKTFRGTIDFKRGSKASVGNEQEDTLLLSPFVVNRAVPVILCGEEDVDGRHGASIGQISPEMLFYMNSRGYSDEEARRLLVQARLLSVARLIPKEDLRWEVEQWIEREIV